MKIRTKIMLWFSAVLIAIAAATMITIIFINSSILRHEIQNDLIYTVENNLDEVEFFENIMDAFPDGDGDDYITYKEGYLEIDDDYLDVVNGNYTALYYCDGTLIYGENPIALQTNDLAFDSAGVRTVHINEGTFYIYDKQLERQDLEGLWLRGVVSAEKNINRINDTVRLSLLSLPILVIAAIIGGYFLAGKILKPIKKIADYASEISEGFDLKKRIELGNGRDELHQLGAALNSMIGRLEKSFEMEKRFSSDVSHELRTPVSVISAQCEYTLEAKRATDEYTDSIRVINRQTKKMIKIISQMLEFTRLETNAEQYEKTKIDFSELITMSCIDFGYIVEKNITLDTNVEENIQILGNHELLTRLVNNLISNAYKYGRENGHVNVTLTAKSGFSILNVKDDGIGISSADIDKIFDRFYRADKSRNSDGMGLGLALAKEIADFHGGTLTCKSKINKGSCFTFIMKAL